MKINLKSNDFSLDYMYSLVRKDSNDLKKELSLRIESLNKLKNLMDSQDSLSDYDFINLVNKLYDLDFSQIKKDEKIFEHLLDTDISNIIITSSNIHGAFDPTKNDVDAVIKFTVDERYQKRYYNFLGGLYWGKQDKSLNSKHEDQIWVDYVRPYEYTCQGFPMLELVMLKSAFDYCFRGAYIDSWGRVQNGGKRREIDLNGLDFQKLLIRGQLFILYNNNEKGYYPFPFDDLEYCFLHDLKINSLECIKRWLSGDWSSVEPYRSSYYRNKMYEEMKKESKIKSYNNWIYFKERVFKMLNEYLIPLIRESIRNRIEEDYNYAKSNINEIETNLENVITKYKEILDTDVYEKKKRLSLVQQEYKKKIEELK